MEKIIGRPVITAEFIIVMPRLKITLNLMMLNDPRIIREIEEKIFKKIKDKNVVKHFVERLKDLIRNPLVCREKIKGMYVIELPGNYDYRLGYYIVGREIILEGIFIHDRSGKYKEILKL